MHWTKLAILPMATLATAQVLSAATLLEFTFETGTDGQLPAPATVDPAVSASSFMAGSGMNVGGGSVASPLYRVIDGNGSLVQRMTKMSAAESEADAVGSSVYWAFTVTPTADPVDLESLDFTFGAYNADPLMSFFIRTDADGDNFTTNLLGSVNGGAATGIFGPTSGTGTLTPVSIDLTAQALDFSGLTGPTTFRIYLFRGDTPANNGKTAGLGDLSLSGAAVPEPASAALLALGAAVIGRGIGRQSKRMV